MYLSWLLILSWDCVHVNAQDWPSDFWSPKMDPPAHVSHGHEGASFQTAAPRHVSRPAHAHVEGEEMHRTGVSAVQDGRRVANLEQGCACSGRFKHMDAVQVSRDEPSMTKGLRHGHRGVVLAAARGPPSGLVLMVEFHGWQHGHAGECQFADCSNFPECQERGSSRWWVLCDDVSLVENVRNETGPTFDLCSWGDWEDWALEQCSATCGHGHMQRKRERRHPEEDSCEGASREIEEMACGLDLCPVDCHWGQWSEWPEGVCSATCGGGVQERTRFMSDASNGGKQCEGNSTDLRPCNDQPCPVDCAFSDWHDWPMQCSVSCGGGMQTRVRDMYREQYGGAACEGMDEEGRSCNTQDCPGNCEWGHWSDWDDECSATCGGGMQARHRSILKYAQNGGRACLGSSQEARTCNAIPCSHDCEWSDWSEWDLHGACTKTCGGGVQVREREVVHEATHGGAPCFYPMDASEERTCMVQPCPTAVHGHAECHWGPWGDWNSCSSTCGAGIRSRQRGMRSHVVEEIWKCIAENGNDTQVASCGMKACPKRDCEWSPWADWSHCTASCAGGMQVRARHHLQEPANGGNACMGDSREQRECNNYDCPGCEHSDWTEWDFCTVSCGGGLQRRLRLPQHPEAHVATERCHMPAEQMHVCRTEPCIPEVCRYASWGDWTDCSATCGAGHRQRMRQSHFAVERSSDGAEEVQSLLAIGASCPEDFEYDQCALELSCVLDPVGEDADITTSKQAYAVTVKQSAWIGLSIAFALML